MHILILKYKILKIDYASCIVTEKPASKFLFEYKKAELTDDNNFIFKWVYKSLFNDSSYCYKQRKMAYDHITKNDDILQNIFKTKHCRGVFKIKSIYNSWE